MSEPYQETIAGEPVERAPLSGSHELLVSRLHRLVEAALPLNSTLKLLPARTALVLGEDLQLRPDLVIVRVLEPGEESLSATLYLVAEVLLPGDHHIDTVVKKQIYADAELPRLWMVDPRYLNVETYGIGEYGFTLTGILANRDELTDPHLPGLACPMDELFAEI